MKILYCIHSTYNSGGMERILSIKANYLAEVCGYDITIVTTEQKGRNHFYSFSDKIKFVDLDINYDDYLDKPFFVQFIMRFIKKNVHFKRLKSFCEQNKFDILISMFEREASFLYKIDKCSKKVLELHFSKFVRTQRNPSGIFYLISCFLSYLDELYAKKYDKFIVLTEEDKTYWTRCKNIEVISNPAISYNSELSILENKQVSAIGRLDYQKGFDSLIKAWQIVHAEEPNWNLQIYGSGPDYDKLLNLISSLNLTDSVFINSPTADIGQVYLNTSIVVSSSRYEGFPLVLLEAISYGIPVVSYKYKCGPKDLIDDSINGFLVEPNDFLNLAESIIKLIRDVSLRKEMGHQAYLKANSYTLDNIMNKWCDVFSSLCN